MITVLYFARFREKLGQDKEALTLMHPGKDTVQSVLDRLVARGSLWSELLNSDQRVLVAVNQEMATRDTTVTDGDELAIFPPVTGG